jgi:hypothetical protein
MADTDTQTDTTQTDDSTKTAVDPAILAEARRYGWRPQDQYKGKDTWVDAEEFVRRGRESLPILKSKLDTAEGRLAKLQSEMGVVMKDAQEAKNIGYKLAAQEWQAKYDALKAEKAVALQDADHEKVVELDEQIAEVKAEKPQPPKLADTTKTDGSIPPEFKSWFDNNKWYETPRLRMRANIAAATIIEDYQNRGEAPPVGIALFEEVKAVMEEDYPEDMGVATKGQAMTHRSTRRTSSGGPGSGGGKTYDNLPADAKAACDRYVARKMCTREEYVKTYDWD